MQNRSTSKSKKNIDYNNPSRLRDYALWYYSKYYPSFGKLRERLNKKTQNESLINEISSELENLYDESYLVGIQVQNLLNRGKSRYNIIQTLTLKKFKKTDIEKALGEYATENHETYLKSKIENSLKTKSIQKTIFNLVSAGYDKELISKIISEGNLMDDPSLLEKEFSKISSQPKEEIIRKLLSKGFQYRNIKELFM